MNDLKAIELINKNLRTIPNKEELSSFLLLAGYHVIGQVEDSQPSLLIGLKYLYLRFCVCCLQSSRGYIALNTSNSLISVIGRTGIVTKTLAFNGDIENYQQYIRNYTHLTFTYVLFFF